MMRVAGAGAGVDCGCGIATERESRAQQQHILTQETEDAVLSSLLRAARRTRVPVGATGAPPGLTNEAGAMARERPGDV